MESRTERMRGKRAVGGECHYFKSSGQRGLLSMNGELGGELKQEDASFVPGVGAFPA